METGSLVTSAIKTAIASDVTNPIECYDLRGRRVTAPQRPGIYIWRQANRSGKFIKR